MKIEIKKKGRNVILFAKNPAPPVTKMDLFSKNFKMLHNSIVKNCEEKKRKESYYVFE